MAKKTKLSDLRTQRQNANKHTDRGIKALDNAIAENGWIGAATIAANGETFDGSARLEVLKKRYGDDIDPIIVDCDGTRPVFVRRTDIANTDDPKAQLLSIQANRITQIDLDWNPDVLADIAKRVKLSSVFEEEELTFIMSKEQRASLVAGLKDKWETEGVEGDEEVADTLQDDDSGYSDDDDIEDELGDRADVKYSGGDRATTEYSGGDRAINGKPIESEQEKAERLAKDAAILADEAQSTIEILEQVETIQSRVKLGDIWRLGRHFICCGDSTVEANVRALLGDRINDVGMIWSDPPFNTKQQQGRTSSEWGIIENDNLSDSDFKKFVERFANIVLKLKPESIYVCCNWRSYPLFSSLFPDINNLIVWVKNNFGLGSGYRPQHELIIFQGKIESNSESNVWKIGRDAASSYKHPMQKPVDLVEKALKNSSKPNDVIVDFFLGSAPSIIAAQRMEGDRTVYGFELSEAYMEVIIQRFEKFSGIEAKLVGTLPQ